MRTSDADLEAQEDLMEPPELDSFPPELAAEVRAGIDAWAADLERRLEEAQREEAGDAFAEDAQRAGLGQIEPYRGEIRLGPEIWEEVKS